MTLILASTDHNPSIEAERAKFIVERSEQERQAAVVRAEGEGEAATIISRALDKAGEGLVQFRRIEASKEIAATLAKGRNVSCYKNELASSVY